MPAAMWDMDRTRPSSRNAGSTRVPINMATGYSYSIKGGPAPSRPPRNFVDSQFETAPPVQEPPPRNPKRNLARNSLAVSAPPAPLHSQPRAIANVHMASRALHRQQDMVDTISPPSSPEPEYRRQNGQQPQSRPRDREVSPIDADRREDVQFPRSNSRNGVDPQRSQQDRTNIPMMRRMRRRQSDAALREGQSRERQASNPTSSQQRGEVRYDAMTGEPTASAAGRPPQVRPAQYAQGLGISTGSSPPQRSPSAMMTAFGDKVRRMRQSSKGDKRPDRTTHDTDPAANAFSSSRPGWRGASGRTAIVDPVRDHLEVAPLKLPQKNTKRVVSPGLITSSTTTQALDRSVRAQTPPVSPGEAETDAGSKSQETIRRVVPSAQIATPVESKHQADGPSYPSPPLSASFDRSDAPSVAAKQLQSSTAGGEISNPPQNAMLGQPQKPTIHRKPPPGHTHQESVSSVYSQAAHAPAALSDSTNSQSLTLAPSDAWVQPPSRFSVTTYATSAANTPRESLDDFDHSNRPPVPETPLQYRGSPQVQQQDGAYMSSPYQPTTTTTTTPSAAAQQRIAALSDHPALRMARFARSTAPRPDSVASDMNKSLPPAPPETSAGATRDRVAMINAQLQALGNRRINITRSVKQMTELMPTDSILDSAEVVHKRELEKKKVEALRRELAEVTREEYELGLKLHRAYKRMDRDQNFEPTTLWVRRVTG